MSKSSEDPFCSEQKLIFGDYTRRWACRATISRSTSPIYEMVLDGWCHRAPARGPIIASSSSSAPRSSMLATCSGATQIPLTCV